MKKRILLVTALVIISLSFTSCRVNWFDKQYDVPWYYIAIPVAIFTCITFFAAGKHIASKKYVCPKCHTSFYPKLFAAMFSIHSNNDRVFKCPCCKRKGFCPPSREGDE